MPQMCATPAAVYFGTFHSKTVISKFLCIFFIYWLPKTWPASTTFKFCSRAEKRLVTGNAIISSSLVVVVLTPFVGALSDRIGRRPLILACALLNLVFDYPLFLLAIRGGTGTGRTSFCRNNHCS